MCETMRDSTYIFRFNVQGGKPIELEVSKEKFEKLSDFCDKYMADKDWKTEKLPKIEPNFHQFLSRIS